MSGVTGDAPAGHETDEEIEAAFQEAENSVSSSVVSSVVSAFVCFAVIINSEKRN